MKEILFIQKDVLSSLAYWIISLSHCVPSKLVAILTDANNWLIKNEINQPNVSVPDFVLYKCQEGELYDYINKMVNNIPSIQELNNRSRENKGDFIDLGALARNISNSIKWDYEKSNSLNHA